MTKNLDSIPYDVFYQVASTLDCHDLIYLSRVNRALNSLTRSELIARRILEETLLYTKEGQEADRTKSGYRAAVGRLFDIKEALATAQPYSASIVAIGSAFLYSGGSLSYIYNHEIRVLDVHGASQVEQVLNIHGVLQRAIPHCNLPQDTTKVSLMHYSHGVVAFLVEMVERQEAWLLAVDMRRRSRSSSRNRRLRLRTQLQSTKRLFVRHNQLYLYYGTHSGSGNRGYPVWTVNCVDLTTGQHLTEKPVKLENFAGYEIGQTVCFEVYEDHLYAVSRLVDFEEEEVDWTSYYVWICLPPGFSCVPQLTRTWRRQHREGPIHDSWYDLSLRHDEATKQLIILECRREWLGSGSDNYRTYYTQPLPPPSEIPRGKQPGCASRNLVSLPDEPLAKTLDLLSKANYEKPRKRLRRHYHSEYQQGGGDDYTPRPDFILAQTKFRTYNLSASAFVDLVNDPCPGPDPKRSLYRRDRLRLRVVSRKRKSPIDEAGEEGPKQRLYRPELTDADDQPVAHSEERFVSRGVQMWPPDDAPPELTELLYPSTRMGKVRAIADERSIVYSVDEAGATPGENRRIVLINFDPLLRLAGLQRLSPGAPRAPQPTPTAAVDMERPHVDDLQRESPVVHATLGKRRTNQTVPLTREESAMYLRFQRGYWLR